MGGISLDGRLRVSGSTCQISTKAHEGRRALCCALPVGGPSPGAAAWADLAATLGRAYEVSAWIKTANVSGRGIAFVAIYQYDANDKLVTFRDFAAVHGTTPWTTLHLRVRDRTVGKTSPPVDGSLRRGGTVWIDDLKLCDVTGLAYHPMNTATGAPHDGLDTAPLALGMFDADYPLKRTTGAHSATGQAIVPTEPPLRLSPYRLGGFGHDWRRPARWIPLLEAPRPLRPKPRPARRPAGSLRGPFPRLVLGILRGRQH